RARELNIFRYVPSDSPVHRMWAGTKIVCLAAIAFALLAKPTWLALAVVGVVAALYALASGLPRSVVGRPPNWFFIGVALAGFFTSLSFGKPFVLIGGMSIGLGGLLRFVRVMILGFLLLSLGLLLGWTTQLADVGAAVDRLA